ncbi:hypothetical protein Tco_0680451 [Tanacetum coccineum]|uniref:Uncharacterized protein n=1 Tax=Tanacetum coccineum TaxID=301880 RepID=A0ABQ4XLF4_9ASTR
MSRPMIRFVKETGCPSVSKVNNTEKSRKPTVKYAEMYRSQRPRGNQRNWNNQKSQQLGSDFVMIKKACYVCGSFEHLQYTCKHKRHVNDQKQVKPVWNNSKRVNHHYSTRITHPNPKRNMIPQAILMRSGRKTINDAKPKAVHNVVKASACWVWKPKNRVIDHVSKYNNASMTLKRFDYIDAQGRFKSVMAWGGMMDQGEDFGIERDSNKSTDKGSESTGEMANVLSSMGAANILASGGLKEVFTTASPPVPPVSLFVPTVAATASEKDSTAAVITTTTAVTPYTRRTRASRGVQEQMSEHLAREPEEEFAQENQRLREQAARDGKIARLHTEGELKMMIDELDRSNEVIAIHLKEYAQAEDVLSLEDKIELITELAKYQKDLAQIKKYQAQQNFKGMTFEQIEETFIPVWESIQDFMPMDSKLKSERFKRPGTLLEKERAKRLKTVEGSEQQSKGNKDVKEKDSDDHDKIINLQQWVVLVRQESLMDITPSIVKAPIYDWKIFKEKLREVYQIFRVGQAPKAYPYFEAMLKEFDKDDMVTLCKLVKDRSCFEPVATDGLWQFEAPIKSWRLYKSCRVHCLIMEGMIIYMLDDVEYPLPKTTLQKMLDHKCEVSFKRCQEGIAAGVVIMIHKDLQVVTTTGIDTIKETKKQQILKQDIRVLVSILFISAAVENKELCCFGIDGINH